MPDLFYYLEVIIIATTRIISMHVNKGKTLLQCLSERTDYIKDPEKTNGGELISSYACDYRTVDAEFYLSKQKYKQLTGREEINDVIAYQVRQSFKPGEVTPEEAHQIGYNFASRFLKGKHAFIVCTHTDKAHIHNHIIWNSTTLDCQRKYRDFLGSGRSVAHLSDLICTEHHLSVIADPKRGTHSYNKWLGNKATPSHREIVRVAIDEILAKKPHSFEAVLEALEAKGFLIAYDPAISLGHPSFKRRIRMYTLGEGYNETSLRAIIQGKRVHIPAIRRATWDTTHPRSIIDIQAKLASGMGEGYRRWATIENLKRMAKTKLYMDEHGLSYEAMETQKELLFKKEKELSAQVTQAQARLAEIQILKTNIINYIKTRDIYVAYKKAGYSKKHLEDHKDDIIIHKAAKKAFDDLGLKKLPTMNDLHTEFSSLLTEKKNAYAELKDVRKELRDLAVHSANYEELRSSVDQEKVEPCVQCSR